MKSRARAASALSILGAMATAGCNPLADGAQIAVIDLAATAKATGQDAVMEQQMEAARVELGGQLTQIAGDLEKKLQDEQSRLGGATAASREKDFQQLAAQARQQLAQTQALAQQKAQEFQQGLVTKYRQAVQPIAAEIARSKGASVVLVVDPTMLWFEPGVDITDEVIAKLRAQATEVPEPAAGKSSKAPARKEAPPEAGSEK